MFKPNNCQNHQYSFKESMFSPIIQKSENECVRSMFSPKNNLSKACYTDQRSSNKGKKTLIGIIKTRNDRDQGTTLFTSGNPNTENGQETLLIQKKPETS